MGLFSKIFGDENQKYLKKVQPIIDEINKLEQKFERFSDKEVTQRSLKLKKDSINEENLDTLIPEAFALVREAAKRTLGQRHYDVQLIGGLALYQGKIAQMVTGEGKTLAATLAVYLNALTGKGVHVITVNDYLARRDVVWMGEIYNFLGLSIGCVNHDQSFVYDPEFKNIPVSSGQQEDLDKERDEMGAFKIVQEYLRPVEKREAYLADLTYGTNNEFGFDYLRDNMAYSPEQRAQAKGHNFVIIDEVDSILIDEARTPLIISAPDADSVDLYQKFAGIAPKLKENEDYNIDEKLRAATLTENGIEKVEKILGVANIYEEGGVRHVHHLEQALKAQVLFTRDKDYVIKEGQVIIVDEFTGRLMPGRRWSEGLHQAVEAKEGVKIERESRTLATITFQNYFRLYKKISGMTGTASTSSEEFHKVYGLTVIEVPTNKPLIRENLPDKIFKTEKGKFKMLAREIKERHETGQPVLVGTVSIEKNEFLSKILEREGIPQNVLNAKNHDREGEIIAQAGKLGAVTVATNMAGRGVDIVLGGNPRDPEQSQKVKELGGLHVIGTERHEARRIDDQLRGRSGRQGDPGSSQFFISTEDEVVRIFGGDRLKNIMDKLGVGEEDVIENRFISKAIEQAQSKIEGHNFDIRKYVLEYDDVMNRHRSAVYKLRNEAVDSKDISNLIQEYIHEQIERLIQFHVQKLEESGLAPNMEEVAETIKTFVSPQAPPEDLHSRLIELSKSRHDGQLLEYLKEVISDAYKKREEEIGGEKMRHLEKLLLLRVIDESWMDHLSTMDYLKDSVRLRAYGQRDPLVEYRIEGQKLFGKLMDGIKIQVANLIFKVGFVGQPQQTRTEEKRPNDVPSISLEKPSRIEKSNQERQDQPKGNQGTVVNKNKIGRNFLASERILTKASVAKC